MSRELRPFTEAEPSVAHITNCLIPVFLGKCFSERKIVDYKTYKNTFAAVIE